MSRIPLYKHQKIPKRGRSHTMDKRQKFLSRSTSDSNRRPDPYTRAKCWVRSHTRGGIKIRGHFRKLR